jgi:dynein heavy chain 1
MRARSCSDLEKQQTELVKTIGELEAKIRTYKEEYAKQVTDVEQMKVTMADVQRRVDRSVALLANLAREAARWATQRESFQHELGTMVGDVLLCSAFLAYAGFFDQHYRDALLSQWRARLDAAHIAFKKDLSLSSYLAPPEQQLAWQANDLPPGARACVCVRVCHLVCA